VTVVSTTDYWTQRSLGPVGVLAVQALERRALDQELEASRPELQWVKDVRRRIEENKPNPRVIVGGEVVSPGKPAPTELRGHSVDYRPDWLANFDLTLGHAARDAIVEELRDVSRFKIETGGLLFAHQRRRFFADVVKASGPAPNSKHTRTSVEIGSVANVRAEFGEFAARADLKNIGCWHSHPWTEEFSNTPAGARSAGRWPNAAT
jgi:hypothetical protein